MARPIFIVVCICAGSDFLLAGSCFAEDRQTNQNKNQPSMEDILKVWEAREEKIRSAHFEWLEHHAVTPEVYIDEEGKIPPIDAEQLAFEFKASFSLENEKNRHTAVDKHAWSLDKHIFHLQDYTASFDGVVSKSLTHDKTGQVKSGIIHPRDLHSATRLLSVKPVWWGYRGKTDQANSSRWDLKVQSGQYEVRGKKCLLLEGPLLKVWVDPNRNYVILRYANINGQTAQFESHLDIWYEEFEGVPVPIRWKFIHRSGASQLREVIDYRVTTYSLNKPLGKNHFSLDFPKGTLVTDISKKKQR